MSPRTAFAQAILFAAVLASPGAFAQTQTAQSAPAAIIAPAATAEPKALGIDEFERWRTITSVTLSDDGQWATFNYQRRKTDDTLHVRDLSGTREILIARASRPQFSDDGAWLAYLVTPTQTEVDKLEKEKKPVPLKAELRNLASGDVVGTWENVASFVFARGSALLAIKKTKPVPAATHEGTDFILRDLRRGSEELIGSVHEFAFNKPGTHLAFTISSASREGNGLYLYDVATASRRPLDGERADYARMTWDEEGSAVAVLRAQPDEKIEQKANVLVTVTAIGSRAAPLVRSYDPATATDAPKDTVLSDRTALTWSSDLARVFVGLKEQSPKIKKDENADPESDVDIWHYADDRLQSVQMIRATADRNRTYTAAFELETRRLVRLADAAMMTVQLTRDGRWGIGRDERGYVHDWKPQLADYYRVDARTGERERFLEAHERTLGLSPDSRNFLYWKDGHIWNYIIAENRHVNLTRQAPVSFVDQEFDRFGEKPPYGVAGWTKDGRAVVLAHRYDLYLQPLDARPATNLTAGYGTRESMRLRHVQLDPEERFIDVSQPLLLSAFGDIDKQSGYFRLERGRVTQLVYRDAAIGRPVKAKHSDRVLVTIERFNVFPDYHITDTQFREPVRLTDANPQQSEYRWGNRILFDFVNSQGVTLQGTLAVPDGYVAGQRLPMLVNFYEKNSQNLYRYPAPRYASSPQFAGFVSNGYLVMQPDIHYSTGASHSQMLDAVEAAVKKVIELGYADPARIGLHGHSYSGQGAAYISTQSKLFTAIVAGAAATNLVSDFNQLWKSAGTNQHRYDTYGQGRFATNPFDDLELYQSQSAVYHARNMDTPLMLLHGTADGSVEWLQAVEFYNALRFNGKPVILLSYPGEQHGLTRFENQKDFLVRMQAFFDHHLKDADAPEWMMHGVPFIDKNRPKPTIVAPAVTTPPGGGGTF
ncbi:MAG TPA: prolyl oligopeptidase family serine peptidase [Longimicrobiales bacterium]|nr:prolyl oligopeptidase family serine peptidase [Longimicrobiales bacterium]